MALARRVRRAEGFAVRRWLQLGAASVGVGAGVLGFSLLGPQVGTAGADTTGESSTSSSPAASGDAGPADQPDSDADTGAEPAADNDTKQEDDSDDAADDLDADDIDADTDDEADRDDTVTDADRDDTDTEADRDGTDTDTDADDDEIIADADADADAESEPAADAVVSTKAANDVVPQDDPQPKPRATTPRPSPADWSALTGQAIDNWTSDSRGWINSLPVDGQAKYHLSGALWATRRTLFNQAPTVAPIQISGKLDGPIVGTVGAVDPDGDRLIYVITRGPKSGSVHLNGDGTYTYTPGTDFGGVDTFRVVAIDAGPHVNLLDPFRPIGVSASNLVNQRAVTFTFIYGTGSEYWTVERRQALGRVADRLVEYFTVTKAVNVTYDVLGEDDPDSTTLAWAYSDPVSEANGFWRTVVQNKIISGVDSNGAASDGEISFNFDNKWGLGDQVAVDEFDFTSTAIHEILHSFGFMTGVGSAGDNTGRSWLIYDRFVVTADGRKPIGSDHVWRTEYDPYLTGFGGGLYFGGANAVAAYGGLVPLFTPNPWRPGSSMHHLDDFTYTGADKKVMNAMAGAGPNVRTLSAIEIGVLRDLGYRVSAPIVQL